ncbi:MAG: glycosyl hydrolase family 8, partial [Fibromonadales bacterium]|nr:glycosyl hydrolase family 8 [Fibromonadales bacterium]
GLMNWRINGFSSVDGQGAATDAEFDAALALVMAYYQFGDEKYLTDARELLAKVRQHEIAANNLHKPGDSWDSEKNPSYISPAAFEIFKEVETDQAAKDKWDAVIAANYTLLRNNQHNTTGLWSDWCTAAGVQTRGEFSYDAIRTPWRLAWANAWYGHADAKTMLGNLDSRWLHDKAATAIRDGINYSTGAMSGWSNSSFVGPLMNALSYTSSNQAKMDTYWTRLMSFNNEPYYSQALQIMTGLLGSGNMPNLKALEENGTSSVARNNVNVAGATGRTPAVSVRGRVLNVTGTNNTPMAVRLVNVQGKTVARFTASGAGQFSIARIPAGRYIVETRVAGKRVGSSAVVVR